MKITFGTKKLEKLANDYRFCKKELGQIRADLYNKRLQNFRDAATLEDVRNLPGHYHELVEDRKGQWGCDLDQPYRLIFKPNENPIPTNKDGQYVWIEILSVDIVEITNYHGK